MRLAPTETVPASPNYPLSTYPESRSNVDNGRFGHTVDWHEEVRIKYCCRGNVYNNATFFQISQTVYTAPNCAFLETKTPAIKKKVSKIYINCIKMTRNSIRRKVSMTYSVSTYTVDVNFSFPLTHFIIGNSSIVH